MRCSAASTTNWQKDLDVTVYQSTLLM